MSDHDLVPGRNYLARIGTRTTALTVTGIKYKIDVNTREHLAAHTLGLNDIALCNLATAAPFAFDPYDQNRATGSFILIDRFTNLADAILGSDGKIRLREHNCAILDVARGGRAACDAELELFREVLGADVVRETHIAAGDRCCTYRIVETS